MMVPNTFIPIDTQAGAAGKSAHRTLSPVPPGQEPFKEALLEKSFEANKRNPLDWVVSIALQAALVAAIVIIPMLVTQQLDLTHFQATYLVNPAPPGAPPPPPPPGAAAARPQQAPHRPNVLEAKLFAPIAIPKTVARPSADDAAPAEAPPVGVEGGVAGGVFGGQLGGVLGGVLGGLAATGGSSFPGCCRSPHGTLACWRRCEAAARHLQACATLSAHRQRRPCAGHRGHRSDYRRARQRSAGPRDGRPRPADRSGAKSRQPVEV